MIKLKTILSITAVSSLAFLASCVSSGDDPGVEYAPDMYVSKGYEPYSQLKEQTRKIEFDGTVYLINKDGKTMRDPVKGTIARGQKDFVYPFANDPDGKTAAEASLVNPVALTQANLAEGRRLYNINCLPCHGDKGLGDGPVSVKFPKGNIPSYKADRVQQLADGGAYHTITYGLNLMGSYAPVLTPEERWKVIHYVNYLKKN